MVSLVLIRLAMNLSEQQVSGYFRMPVVGCILYSYRKNKIYYEFQSLLNSIYFNKLNL